MPNPNNENVQASSDEVWVLSKGEYSDYRVLCVVRGGEAEAKALAGRANAQKDSYSDDYAVELLPVVSSDVQRVEILSLSAELRDAGPSISSERDPHYQVEWPFDSLYGAPKVEWRWVRAPVHHGKGGRLDVWGTDHGRVRKVYSDRKAMLLADDAMRAKGEATGRR